MVPFKLALTDCTVALRILYSYQGGRLTITLDGVLRINLLTDFNNVSGPT